MDKVYFRTWFRDAGRFTNERGSDAARDYADRLERAFLAVSLDQTVRAEVTPLLRWLRTRDE